MPSKKKCIWIVNYYTSSPEKTSNPRYPEFATAFMKEGYDVITFNANTNEGIDFEGKFKDVWYGDHHFVHVKAPQYIGNGLKRMISISCFAMRLFLNRKKFQRPNIVLHNLHTPFDYPICWIAKRFHAKYIAEAWDMWPEDFVTFGFLNANSMAMKFAYGIERKIYEKADMVIFTLEGGLDYIKEKGWTIEQGGKVDPAKVHYVNNGVNLDTFDYNRNTYIRGDKDLTEPGTYKIIYMGAIHLVNHVKEVIDTAILLKDNPKYRFFIYGDGSDREELERYVKDNNVSNVTFKEKRIPFKEVAWVVSQATVNLMNYQKKFGIHGVSSGKMFQYFAAGKPICCNIKLNYSEITRNNLGIDRDIETPEQYAAAIRELAEQPAKEYEAMCERVRETAKRFDYRALAQEELRVIES